MLLFGNEGHHMQGFLSHPILCSCHRHTPSSRRVCTVKNSLAPSPWHGSCMMRRLTSSSFLQRSCNPYPPSEDCLPQSDMLCVLPRQSDTPHPMLTKEVIKRCLGDKCKLMNHSVIEKRPCDFRAVSCEFFSCLWS